MGHTWKKSLKIPKGLSESINRGKDRQYNGQRKSTKGHTTIYKTLHIKLD
jgi:hypothetical protein